MSSRKGGDTVDRVDITSNNNSTQEPAVDERPLLPEPVVRVEIERFGFPTLTLKLHFRLLVAGGES